MSSSSVTQPRIISIYLGKRGGGVIFHRDLVNHFRASDFETFSITRSDSEYRGAHENNYEISPLNFKSVAKLPILNPFKIWRIVNSIPTDENTLVLFSMIHPMNFFFLKLYKRKGLKVGCIIHDAKPHKGERYPPKSMIKATEKRVDFVFCLSNFVKNQLKYSKLKFLIDFPGISHISTASNLRQNEYVLFFGRQKEYKGLALLESAWLLVDSNYHLIIAGDGHKTSKALPRVTFIDYWLTEMEIQSLVRNAKLVLCPYLEASQSGVIHLSHTLGVPVVVTPVGGLEEQIDTHNGIVSEGVAPKQFADAFERALRLSWFEVKPVAHNETAANQIKKLLSN